MYQMHDVPPDCLKKWQEALDRLSETLDVPAALLMRVWPEQIEVLVSSFGDDNPYDEHEKADLGTGLYCETVMATRDQLRVPNALDDPVWKDNPDVRLNMISYLGVPLVWPDDTIFGTMCVLDSRTREYPESYQTLLWKLKKLIENDFRLISQSDDGTLSPEERDALELEIKTLVQSIRHSPAS